MIKYMYLTEYGWGGDVALGYMLLYLTTARNIDLTGFSIKSSICWHMEMKNIKEKLDI